MVKHYGFGSWEFISVTEIEMRMRIEDSLIFPSANGSLVSAASQIGTW